jgi:adenine phosphoribosyltransferase
VLATGGTMAAACDLLRQIGARIVGVSFVIALGFLQVCKKLNGYEMHSLLQMDGR